MKTNIVSVVRLSAVVCCLLVSYAASATDISVSYNGAANFGSGSVGYGSGGIWPNPNTPNPPVNFTPVGIGGDSFTNNSVAGFPSLGSSFNAWCVDITHFLYGGMDTYHVGTQSDLAAVFSSARANDLVLLANQRYSSVNDQNSSAAFQLATWAVMFGTSDSGGNYSLNSATFAVTNGTTGSVLATTYLDQLHSYSGNLDSYTINYLYGGVPATQSLVAFTPTVVVQNIPEPGSYAMLLAGLGLLSMVVSRRSRLPGK